MLRVKASIAILLTWLLTPALALGQHQDLLFTGEVFSQQAQEIIVPLTNSWRASIGMMLPEGSQVQTGDVVVEFDGSLAAQQLEQQLEAQRTEKAKTERDIARLEKELAGADFQLKQGRVTLELATLKADIPEGLVGGLEFSENQLAKEKAIKGVEDASEQLKDKKQSVAERHRQAELDQQKGENQVELWNRMLESFAVYADQPGFVIYGRHPWTRTKFQEGDTVRTSFRVAQIADTSDLAIRVWINGVDRPQISAGSSVKIVLDALPGSQYEGKLNRDYVLNFCKYIGISVEEFYNVCSSFYRNPVIL